MLHAFAGSDRVHRCLETASSASILHSLSLPADEQRLAGHHLHSLLPPLHCQEERHAPDGMRFAQSQSWQSRSIHVPESLSTIQCNHLSQCAMHVLVCILRYGEQGTHAASVLRSCTACCIFDGHTMFVHALGVSISALGFPQTLEPMNP